MNSYMFPSVLHLQTQQFWSKAIGGSCSYESSPCQLSSAKHEHELTPIIPKGGKQTQVDSTRIQKLNSLKDTSSPRRFLVFPVSVLSVKCAINFHDFLVSCGRGEQKITSFKCQLQCKIIFLRRKRFTERQSFKDIFCESLRATQTSCDICTN